MSAGDGTVSDPDRADFRHVDTWIFDLDNTLYPATSAVFPQIDARMTLYIMRALKIPAVEAKGLQHAYYRRYGTTLAGLMAVHRIDPEGFLAFVHDVDLAMLAPDADLRAALARLPGRRLVFTNGSGDHASRVLERLGLADLIDGIWDIRKSDYVPKPAVQPYRRLLAAYGVDPARAAYFEDLVRNLVPARRLGLTTVWLSSALPWGGVDPKAAGSEDADAPPAAGFSSGAGTPINHVAGNLAGFLRSIRISNGI